MRNDQAPIVQETCIVHTMVTRDIFNFFYHDSGKFCDPGEHSFSMDHIHIYLTQNLEILMKKFFFTVNESDLHWSGWVAINPWVQIARVLYERAKMRCKES